MHKSIQNHHLVVGFITFRFLHGIRTVFGTVFRTVFKNSVWKVKILLLTHQKSSTPPTFVKQRFLLKKFNFTPVLGCQRDTFRREKEFERVLKLSIAASSKSHLKGCFPRRLPRPVKLRRAELKIPRNGKKVPSRVLL